MRNARCGRSPAGRIWWGWILFAGVGALLWLPRTGAAAKVDLEPSLGLRGTYDDNVAFTARDEDGDFEYTASPGVSLRYATHRLALEAAADADFRRYPSSSRYNREQYRYEGNAAWRMAERFQLRGNARYIQDSTLESTLEDTGIVTTLGNRYRFGAGGGVAYDLTERSDLGVDYQYARTAFSSDDEDYETHGAALAYNLRLRNERDVFTLQPAYGNLDSSESQVDRYSLTLGWAHPFSETLNARLFGGARYAVIDQDEEETDRSWGGLADLSLEKVGETAAATLGYRRDLAYSPDGETIQLDRIYGSARKRLGRRLWIGSSAAVTFTSTEGAGDQDNTRYVTVRPTVRYQLTADHVLSCSYRYSYERDDEGPQNESRQRNQVWVDLSFRFPKTL